MSEDKQMLKKSGKASQAISLGWLHWEEKNNQRPGK